MDTLGYVSPDCELSNALVFCNDRELSIPQRNQENRVKRYLSSIDFNYIVDQEISSCLEEHYAKPFFLLVARDAAVKGVYEVTMEDVDRLVTEVDLLMTLRKDENTK
ncbi:MAG: hypothetical protein KI790_01795 [Cyclobacteriaceae bacterium]|nr:hypothetical protein [Cyclobacteriaceae bacterium HetDA_MAG_MS6]